MPHVDVDRDVRPGGVQAKQERSTEAALLAGAAALEAAAQTLFEVAERVVDRRAAARAAEAARGAADHADRLRQLAAG